MPGFRIPGDVDMANPVVRREPAASVMTRDPLALRIDAAGLVHDAKVRLAIRPMIERGAMATIHGIVVHQTGAPTARSSLDSYLLKGANGAHFLIDKDGTVHQTASVAKITHHVGQLKPRCRVEMRCTPTQTQALAGKQAGRSIGRVERAKSWPDRYPGNSDAIGVEFVSAARPKPGGSANEFEYDPVTREQQAAFDWLLPRLLHHFDIRATEMFRHPDVSWKQPSEASSVRW